MKKAFMPITAIATCGFIMMMAIGWILNIVKLTKCDFEPSYKAEIIRIIGIPVSPVGMIAGYMDIGR